jgi:hypothetical protein
MPAFFAYRSPWGCAGTSADEDEQHRRAEAQLRDELGCHPYGLSSLFTVAAREGLLPPRSEADLFALLYEYLYVEGDKREHLLCRPGAIQVRTDDDNLNVAYFFCDDGFLREHGHLAAFLLHEPWRLPAACGPGSFPDWRPVRPVDTGRVGEGGTYLAVTKECGKGEFATLAEQPGVRLSELAAFLRAMTPAELVLLWLQLPDEDDDALEVPHDPAGPPGISTARPWGDPGPPASPAHARHESLQACRVSLQRGPQTLLDASVWTSAAFTATTAAVS